MKVNVTQVETLTFQLNRDEAIALRQMLQVSKQINKFGDIRDKTRANLIAEIESGLGIR